MPDAGKDAEEKWPDPNVWGAMPSIEAAEDGEDSYHLHRWLRPEIDGQYEEIFFFHAEKEAVDEAADYLNALQQQLADMTAERDGYRNDAAILDGLYHETLDKLADMRLELDELRTYAYKLRRAADHYLILSSPDQPRALALLMQGYKTLDARETLRKVTMFPPAALTAGAKGGTDGE